MRSTKRARRATARSRRHRSLGAASVEYGLLLALVAGAICLGVGYSLRDSIQGLFCSLISQMSPSSSACGGAGGSGPPGVGGGGSGGGGTGGGGGGPVPTSTATPTPTPTPTPTVTPTPTPTP